MVTEAMQAETRSRETAGTTGRLADFVVTTGYAQIPAEARDIAKRAMLDNLGCALAGAGEPATNIIARHVRRLGGKREAGVIARRFKAPAAAAALVNGTMAHVLDYDDVATSWWGHPTVVLMPAVLAVAQREKLSGESVLEAYILGFEVGSRLNRGLGIGYYQAGWHSTMVAGTMAAAVATAKLLHLDARGVRITLGIAASLSGGLKRNFGTMTKSFHAGTAAQNGITAASLAREGFTADEGIIEAPQGFCELFSGDYKLDRITTDLGAPFDIVSPGLSIKPYPCCRIMHQSIDAVLALVREHGIKAADVSELRCCTSPAIPIQLYYHQPRTGLEGKFSIEYCMAVAILDGGVKLAQFEDRRVVRQDVQGLLRKVRYVHPEGVDWAKEPLPQEVTIKLADGREFSRAVRYAKGEPKNPLTEKELLDKFRDCARQALSPQDTDRSVDMVLGLEQLKDISPLMDLLTAAGG
jgi:2-methylcitrate dehydratase PrpD